MSSGDLPADLVKTASLTLPPEIVGAAEDTEKQGVANGHIGSAAEGESGISYRRLVTIMIGLCLSIFLTALDQVIILVEGEVD